MIKITPTWIMIHRNSKEALICWGMLILLLCAVFSILTLPKEIKGGIMPAIDKEARTSFLLVERMDAVEAKMGMVLKAKVMPSCLVEVSIRKHHGHKEKKEKQAKR